MTNDDLRNEDVRESRLARLIAATRAEANPAVLARARARILGNDSAPSRLPGVAAWLGRPAVLAGAGALLVLCVAGTFAVSQRAAENSSATETSLISALVGEEDLGLPIASSDAASGGAGAGSGTTAGDSGGVAQ